MCNAFAIIDFFKMTTKQSGLSVRLAAEIVLDKLFNGVICTCDSEIWTCINHCNYFKYLI